MTRDELIDAGILALMNAERAAINLEPLTCLEQALLNDVDIIRPQVEAIADTFFAALKEPTKSMICDGYIAAERDICLVTGTVQTIIGRSVFQAMLAASPLSPEGGKTI